jgi:hypothetical protein
MVFGLFFGVLVSCICSSERAGVRERAGLRDDERRRRRRRKREEEEKQMGHSNQRRHFQRVCVT